jgi:hypothetical protein
MSAVHIDLIVGNRHNVRSEEDVASLGGRQSLPHTVENLSENVLRIPINLSESLAESIAEDIMKTKVCESAQCKY